MYNFQSGTLYYSFQILKKFLYTIQNFILIYNRKVVCFKINIFIFMHIYENVYIFGISNVLLFLERFYKTLCTI